MNEAIAWLLDLQTLEWGAEGASLGFERPIPAWGWLLIGVGALSLSLWSYWRLVGPSAARIGLAVLRAALVVALAVLIAGPRLVKGEESIERDWVVVLVDRSASMSIRDVTDGAGRRLSREEQLRSALEASWPMWRELSEGRTVLWLGFDAGAFDLEVGGAGEEGESLELGEADGVRTAIGAALDQALARAAARPLSGVVVVSDGRSIDGLSRGAMRRLQSEQVPVHTVALGSSVPLGDYVLRRAEGPGSAFVDDVTPVRVDVERVGGAGASGANVRLMDSATGLVLDERRVEFGGEEGGESSESVTLTHRPTEAGSRTWVVEIVPDGADLVEANNASEIAIDLVDRPMRVLYVDGYPRWEQRFLRNLLLREKSVVSSGLMLAADRRYTQEGDVELDVLPDSPETWAEYDVVMIGDVRPDVFTWDQLTQIRDHVSERGAGLVWIGGMSQTPESWWDTPLGDLIPFARTQYTGVGLTEPFVVEPTPVAERLGVLRLSDDVERSWPAELSDPSVGWSMFHWGQLISPAGVKPTAEVLAHGRLAFTDEAVPLLLTMRYGAGRVVYVATDETWRYRYARGEILFERLWLQLIRMLGRESLSRSGRMAMISVSPDRVIVEQPVRIEVELLDQALVDLGLGTVGVRLVREPEPGDPEDLGPIEAEVTLRAEGGGGRRYSSTWLPASRGRWRVETSEAELAGLSLTAEVEVTLPDSEFRTPQTDHASLEDVSTQTGGVSIPPEAMGVIADRLPNRQVRLLTERSETLWDTPLALIVVLTLLTAEWVGRRVIRLI